MPRTSRSGSFPKKNKRNADASRKNLVYAVRRPKWMTQLSKKEEGRNIRDSIMPGTSRTIGTPDSSSYNLSPDCLERSGSSGSLSERDFEMAPATPDALTEPNSPGLSDRLTPDLSIEIFNQMHKPQKKRINSDDSEAFEDSPQRKRPMNFMWDDSDEENIF